MRRGIFEGIRKVRSGHWRLKIHFGLGIWVFPIESHFAETIGTGSIIDLNLVKSRDRVTRPDFTGIGIECKRGNDSSSDWDWVILALGIGVLVCIISGAIFVVVRRRRRREADE